MASTVSLTIDAISRNKIIQDIQTNYFVEAGAGSGKTTMLVNRMVAMVEQGIDISKICAVTFTKAAAGEFYARFQKLLAERSNPTLAFVSKGYAGELPAPTALTQERCARALQNIDLCFMGTIDAFCNMVLSEHPYESGISCNAELLSKEEAAAIYKQFFAKTAAGVYGAALKKSCEAFIRLHTAPEEVFVAGMTYLMEHQDGVLGKGIVSDPDVDGKFKSDVINLQEHLTKIQELQEQGLSYDKADENLEAWKSFPTLKQVSEGYWQGKLGALDSALKKFFKARLMPIKTPPEAITEEFEEHLSGKEVKWLELSECGLIKGLQKKLSEYRYVESICFFKECLPELVKVMAASGKLSYFDYLFKLRNLLAEDAKHGGKLTEYIYNRHSYFLLDEFQDTNPLQAEVFFYLTAESPMADWSMCVPRPGSLFIVGDPKQSIYRFKAADVSSFNKIKKLFRKPWGRKLYLTQNFRSTKELCEYYNKVFEELMPKSTDNQSKFVAIPDSRTKQPKGATGVYTYPSDTKAKEEADRLLQVIKTLVNNPKYLIKEDEDKPLRPISYKDIMVITLPKDQLPEIKAKLDENNIPNLVEGKVPFDTTEALTEIIKLYNAVTDGSNAVAVYEALRGKILNLDEKSIVSFCNCGGRLSLYKILAAEAATTAAAKLVLEKLNFLKKLQEECQGMLPAAIFNKLLESSKLFSYVSTKNMEVLYYTLELLRAAEKSGEISSIRDGSAFLVRLTEKKEVERCLKLTAEPDCVRVANLHKVKGLEAPVVILAGKGKGNEKSLKFGTVREPEVTNYIFNLYNEGFGSAYITSDAYLPYNKVREEEKKALEAELLRQIYVAATRAKNILIVSDTFRTTQKGVTHGSIWEPLLKGATEEFVFEAGAPEPMKNEKVAKDLYASADSTFVLANTLPKDASYETKTPSTPAHSPKIGSEDADTNNETTDSASGGNKATEPKVTTSNVHKFSLLYGTMVHKLMEMLVVSKNTIAVDLAVESIMAEFLTAPAEAYKDEFETSLKRIAATMKKGGYVQTNGGVQDLLAELSSAEELACEVPFSYSCMNSGKKILWSGTIDLIYCKQGQWHIIDYKTNLDGTDLDTKYKDQLKAYVDAFKEINGFTADARIYHIAE